MNYTKPREELLRNIRANAQAAVSRNISGLEHGPMSGMGYRIEAAITEGIMEAIKVLMMSTYTDNQFEEDLKLKD